MKKIFLLVLVVIAIGCSQKTETFKNPVLPGFHPDPSLCRVGNDYYMVTSSFEWFPGIPIFHSLDLMNWEQIGYVLTRPSQLSLNGVRHSRGIWAATIRYHEGKFYVISTAVDAGGGFYVTADDPRGPWSEPVFLDTPGIDPTIFFDDDGSSWYLGCLNGTPNEDRYPNEERIYIQKLDLEQGKVVGPRIVLTTGHAVNAPYAEGPHIYKIDGKYMLLLAEGGTWEEHAVTVFKSDSLTGPYTPGIVNPVLTHRFLGKDVDISCIGHADLCQTQDGRWFALMLGIRPREGYKLLGRETFLTSVEFQDGWPVFNPGIGRVLMEDKVTGLEPHPFEPTPSRDDFDKDSLALCWNFLRTPISKWYELKDGKLIMDLRSQKISDLDNPSLIARRIEHFNFSALTEMDFSPQNENEEAGMIVIQNGNFNYRLVKHGCDSIFLYRTEKGEIKKVASAYFGPGKVYLAAESDDGLHYTFRAGNSEKSLKIIAEGEDASILSRNKAGGFTGPFVGMYASSNGIESSNKVSFEFFEYIPE